MKKHQVEVYNVNGVLYRVVERADAEEHGECDREKALIIVRATLNASGKRVTKRHELGHAAWWESGIYHRQHRLYGERIADDIEEEAMEQFLPVLYNIRRVR